MQTEYTEINLKIIIDIDIEIVTINHCNLICYSFLQFKSNPICEIFKKMD